MTKMAINHLDDGEHALTTLQIAGDHRVIADIIDMLWRQRFLPTAERVQLQDAVAGIRTVEVDIPEREEKAAA